jgi:hypothetical protein
MGNIGALVVTLVIYAVGLYALYWVIRLAVRHAIKDSQGSGPL